MKDTTNIYKTSYLYDNLPIGLFVISVLLIFLNYLLLDNISYEALLTWTSLNLIVITLRFFSYFIYKRHPINEKNNLKYHTIFTILSLATALLMGSSAYFLNTSNLTHQMMSLFILIALAGGATISLAADIKILTSYILFLLLPSIYLYLFSDNPDLRFLSIYLIFYAFIVINLSKKSYSNVLLSYKNKDLQKTLQEQLRTIKEKEFILQEYKNIVDESSILSITNTKGEITYVNDKFCDISGYTREELIGKTHSLVKDPDTKLSTFKELWHTISILKKTWNGTLKNRKKDGTFYWVDATIKPISNLDGSIDSYIALRVDITEAEANKELLKSSLEDKHKLLEETTNYISQYEDANGMFTSILKTDTNNIITYANEEFCMLSGYTLNELIGINCQDLRHPDHIDRGDCINLQKTLASAQPVPIFFTNIAKDKSEYYMDTLVYPITDKDGVVIEHLHLMHDVSELTNLHNEMEETQKELVYKMGEIGESRSQETGNHVKRVANYSRILAKLYGLSEQECHTLMVASPMHDIGKVAISDNILKKPGKLTESEFTIMKTHAEIGYNVLKGSNREILKAAAIVAHEHHEKYDGSGYPRGLKGDDIHIYGRITAIADVFDALGSDRCYKKAWEDDEIFKLLQENAGTSFDPQLIELFIKNKNLFFEIRDKFKDA